MNTSPFKPSERQLADMYTFARRLSKKKQINHFAMLATRFFKGTCARASSGGSVLVTCKLNLFVFEFRVECWATGKAQGKGF